MSLRRSGSIDTPAEGAVKFDLGCGDAVAPTGASNFFRFDVKPKQVAAPEFAVTGRSPPVTPTSKYTRPPVPPTASRDTSAVVPRSPQVVEKPVNHLEQGEPVKRPDSRPDAARGAIFDFRSGSATTSKPQPPPSSYTPAPVVYTPHAPILNGSNSFDLSEGHAVNTGSGGIFKFAESERVVTPRAVPDFVIAGKNATLRQTPTSPIRPVYDSRPFESASSVTSQQQPSSESTTLIVAPQQDVTFGRAADPEQARVNLPADPRARINLFSAIGRPPSSLSSPSAPMPPSTPSSGFRRRARTHDSVQSEPTQSSQHNTSQLSISSSSSMDNIAAKQQQQQEQKPYVYTAGYQPVLAPEAINFIPPKPATTPTPLPQVSIEDQDRHRQSSFDSGTPRTPGMSRTGFVQRLRFHEHRESIPVETTPTAPTQVPPSTTIEERPSPQPVVERGRSTVPVPLSRNGFVGGSRTQSTPPPHQATQSNASPSPVKPAVESKPQATISLTRPQTAAPSADTSSTSTLIYPRTTSALGMRPSLSLSAATDRPASAVVTRTGPSYGAYSSVATAKMNGQHTDSQQPSQYSRPMSSLSVGPPSSPSMQQREQPLRASATSMTSYGSAGGRGQSTSPRRSRSPIKPVSYGQDPQVTRYNTPSVARQLATVMTPVPENDYHAGPSVTRGASPERDDLYSTATPISSVPSTPQMNPLTAELSSQRYGGPLAYNLQHQSEATAYKQIHYSATQTLRHATLEAPKPSRPVTAGVAGSSRLFSSLRNVMSQESPKPAASQPLRPESAAATSTSHLPPQSPRVRPYSRGPVDVEPKMTRYGTPTVAMMLQQQRAQTPDYGYSNGMMGSNSPTQELTPMTGYSTYSNGMDSMYTTTDAESVSEYTSYSRSSSRAGTASDVWLRPQSAASGLIAGNGNGYVDSTGSNGYVYPSAAEQAKQLRKRSTILPSYEPVAPQSITIASVSQPALRKSVNVPSPSLSPRARVRMSIAS